MRFWCYAKGEEFNFDGVWGIFENTQQNESSSSSSSLLLELISQITTSYMYAQHEKRERENWISFLTSHPATLRHPIEHSSKKHKVDEQREAASLWGLLLLLLLLPLAVVWASKKSEKENFEHRKKISREKQQQAVVEWAADRRRGEVLQVGGMAHGTSYVLPC